MAQLDGASSSAKQRFWIGAGIPLTATMRPQAWAMPWTRDSIEDQTCPVRDPTDFEKSYDERKRTHTIRTQSMPSDFWPINTWTGKNLRNWDGKHASFLSQANLTAQNKQHVLPVRRLAHQTHELQASQIIQPDGGAVIKGYTFSADSYRNLCIREDDCWIEPDGCKGLAALGSLVWFGVELDSEVNNHIRKNVTQRDAGGYAISDSHLAQLATSPLFSGVSRYGNLGFSASVEAFTDVVESAFDCEETSSDSTVDHDDSAAKHPKLDTSACFHSGGTLLYQREVAYCKVTNFRTVFIFVHFVILKKYKI